MGQPELSQSLSAAVQKALAALPAQSFLWGLVTKGVRPLVCLTSDHVGWLVRPSE